MWQKRETQQSQQKIQNPDFSKYTTFDKNSNVDIFWEDDDDWTFYNNCNPNNLTAHVTGLNNHHINEIRKISYRRVPNLAISVIDFKHWDADLLPEISALKISLLPLKIIEEYTDESIITDLNGYYQCELKVNALEKDVVVYPDMINFERFNTPLRVAEIASDTPLFTIGKGDSIYIHCYIAKGIPSQNARWASVVTFTFFNNTINPYSEDYTIEIETNGSLDPKYVFEKSLQIYKDDN